MSSDYHIPVLLHAGIRALITDPNGIYADATFGGGGHSKEILHHLGPQGKLFCFDQDPEAHKNFIREFSATQSAFIPQNFRFMQKFLRVQGVTKVNGIFADLGVSSHQFDEAARGFSTRFDARLDMRMDTKQAFTAYDCINTYSQEQLKNIFSTYGEIRNSNQLAAAIVNARKEIKTETGNGIQTTGELKNIALTVVKGERNVYLAQLFQAIRIEVNDEMGALKEMLESTPHLIIPGGRLVVISYHSLEDRMLKNMIRSGNVYGNDESDLMGRRDVPFEIITKKPIVPDAEELKRNPRSRSAKMRVGQRK